MRLSSRVPSGLLIAASVAVALSTSSAIAAPLAGQLVVTPGHGEPDGFVVSGRALEARAPDPLSTRDSKLKNLGRTLDALESDELRQVDITVTVAGHDYAATTDVDGFFTVAVRGLDGADALPPGPVPIRVAFAAPDKVTGAPVDSVVQILTPGGLALISDIDDTVLVTEATDKPRMLARVLTANAEQLTPVAGAADAYQRLRTDGVEAVFYVSSSPAALAPRLLRFLEKNGFPPGPMALKNLGDDALLAHGDYKRGRIEQVLRAHPTTRFLLVGDSGEHDPEIYDGIRTAHPDQIAGIAIRQVPGRTDPPGRLRGMIPLPAAWRPLDLVAVRAAVVAARNVARAATPTRPADVVDDHPDSPGDTSRPVEVIAH